MADLDKDFQGLARRTKRTICVELRRPAIIDVFKPIDDKVVYPETFFKALCELITFMLGGSMVITFIFNRQAIWDNPLNSRIGYPNMCVSFDTFPAKYFAVFCWGFIIYLGFRFAWLDLERTLLVQKKNHRLTRIKIFISIATDVLFMLSLACFTMVFVIPPTEGVWKHSGAFIILIAAMYLIVLANVMEAKNAPTLTWVWTILFGILSIADVTMILGNFVYYDRTGTGPLFPWWLGFVADYGWFLSVVLCNLFLPQSEGVEEIKKIVEIGELKWAEKEDDPICFGIFGDEEDEESS